MKKVELVKLLEIIAVGLVLTLVAIMFVQVFARKFLSSIPVWSGEEVATLLLIWVTNIGAAIAAANNSHLSMDYFFEKLPNSIRAPLQIVIYAIICIFLIGIAIVSINLAWSGRFASTARLNISMFWIQGSIFVGMSIMFYYYCKHLFKSILSFTNRKGTTPIDE